MNKSAEHEVSRGAASGLITGGTVGELLGAAAGIAAIPFIMNRSGGKKEFMRRLLNRRRNVIKTPLGFDIEMIRPAIPDNKELKQYIRKNINNARVWSALGGASIGGTVGTVAGIPIGALSGLAKRNELEKKSSVAEPAEINKDNNNSMHKLKTSLLAFGAATTPRMIFNTAVAPLVTKQNLNAGGESRFHSSIIVNKVKHHLGATDANVHLNTQGAHAGMAFYLPEKLNKFQQKIMGGRFGDIDPGVHMLSGGEGGILENESAILGHELGHHRNFKVLQKMKLDRIYNASRSLGMAGSGIGTLLTATAKNDKDAKRNALISAGITAPTILEEGIASARSIRGLSKMYGGLGRALTRGGGAKMLAMNSSYLLAPAAPLIAYGVRKAMSREKDMQKTSELSREEKGNRIKNYMGRGALIGGVAGLVPGYIIGSRKVQKLINQGAKESPNYIDWLKSENKVPILNINRNIDPSKIKKNVKLPKFNKPIYTVYLKGKNFGQALKNAKHLSGAAGAITTAGQLATLGLLAGASTAGIKSIIEHKNKK